MTDQEAKRSTSTAKTYPKRLPAYDNEEGEALARALATKRGISVAALLRMLVREEAKRQGIGEGAE